LSPKGHNGSKVSLRMLILPSIASLHFIDFNQMTPPIRYWPSSNVSVPDSTYITMLMPQRTLKPVGCC